MTRDFEIKSIEWKMRDDTALGFMIDEMHQRVDGKVSRTDISYILDAIYPQYKKKES